MSKFRFWAFKRRLLYGTGFTAFWCLIGVLIYFSTFYAPANCFDGLQNGRELATDCGGKCVRICALSVTPPEVVWTKSFKIVAGQYNAVAYIENKNATAGTMKLEYNFKLLRDGEIIGERSGTTALPPNTTYPVFEGRIFTAEGLEPTETLIELKSVEVWQPAEFNPNQFSTLSTELLTADSRPRLNVNIQNTELAETRNTEVVAIIFNQARQPVTASQTFIDILSGRGTKDIVFTWPNSIAQTVRSCVVPSDIMLVLDRSGSMAADGGSPPEPLESAKQAAKSFLNQTQSTDLIGFLSYATTPSNPLEQSLTSDHAAVSASIQATAMGTNGVQYTDMGAAIDSALTELTSSRHREEARKVLVFLSDGDVTRPLNPVTQAADRDYAAGVAKSMAEKAKAENVTIYTIGFGDLFKNDEGAVKRDVDLLQSLASDPDKYYSAPTAAELAAVYQEIAKDLCEEGELIIDVIPKSTINFAPLR